MKQRILKLVSQIKDNLKSIDKDGVSHPLHDDIYEQLALIEDELYDEESFRFDEWDEDTEDFK